MKLTGLRLTCLFITILFVAIIFGYPASNSEALYNLQAIENMRQIPQWHCLRYRKFDFVRRCRNYRLGRRH
ncbi:hypothetical protein ACFW04_005164 [Cataglyphis niger]